MTIHEDLKDVASQEVLNKIPAEKLNIINKFWEDKYFSEKTDKRLAISDAIRNTQIDFLSKYEELRYNSISMRTLIHKYYEYTGSKPLNNINSKSLLDENLINTLKTKYNIDTEKLFGLYLEILAKDIYPESLGEYPVCQPHVINIFWKRKDLQDKDKKAQAIISVFKHFNNYYEDGIEPYDFYEAYEYMS